MDTRFAPTAALHRPWRERREPLIGLPAQPGTVPNRDVEFVALQAAYRSWGGIARGDALADRMSEAGRGGYLDLARRIVAGQLFSFQWNDCFWLPMFQFERPLLVPHEPARRVLDELCGTLDGWAIARWYVAPNEQLNGQRPLDRLDLDLRDVLAAARLVAARH